MPSKTRTPDLLAVSGLVTPPVTAKPTGPLEGPGTEAAGVSDGGTVRAGAGGEPAWGGMRLVAVPNGWPPYDCETHGAACAATAPEAGRPPPRPAAAGEAAGNAAGARDAAVAGEAVAAWAAVPVSTGTTAGTGTIAGTGTAEADRAASQNGGTGQAAGQSGRAGQAAGRNGAAGQDAGLSAAWPGQFAQVLVEILAGFRPAKQLAPWATERVRAQVDLLSRAADAEQRPRIRRVMTSRPTAGVVEMTMVVGFGARSRALAMRFEHIPARPAAPGRPPRPARWLCTEIETR